MPDLGDPTAVQAHDDALDPLPENCVGSEAEGVEAGQPLIHARAAACYFMAVGTVSHLAFGEPTPVTLSQPGAIDSDESLLNSRTL